MISGPLLQKLLGKFYAKKFNKLVQFIQKEPLLAALIILLGGLIGSYITNSQNSAYSTELKEQLATCKYHAEVVKEEYEENIHLKDTTNQFFAMVMANKDLKKVKLNYNPDSTDKLTMIDGNKPPISAISQSSKLTPPKGDENPAGKEEVTNEDNGGTQSVEDSKSPELNKPRMTAQALAACVLMAANTYKVPPAVLIGIMQVEGGHIGEEVKLTKSSYGLGPYRISTKYLPDLAERWHVSEETAKLWVRDDGCVNVNVGAWLLASSVSEAGSLYGGIVLYQTKSKKEGIKFAAKVIEAMDEKGLIVHDRLGRRIKANDQGDESSGDKKAAADQIRDVKDDH